MLKIWGRNNSINVQKVLWTAAELGLRHERVDVGGAFGGLDTDAFAAMNPNRRIPVLEDGEFVLWESHAIVRYLARTYGERALMPRDARAEGLVDQWMDWTNGTLLAPLTVVFWGQIRLPADQRDRAAEEQAALQLGDLFAMVDASLAGRDYLLGDRLTAADIPVGAAAYRWYGLDLERPDLPNVRAWYQRLAGRTAYRSQVMLPLS